MTARLQRFTLDKPVSVIVKNARSRCTCFWFNLANVSASGVGLCFTGRGFVPFAEGSILHLTVDLSSAIFSRPIHLTVVVRRRSERTIQIDGCETTEVFLGAEITESDKLHQAVWIDGLSRFGDPFKQDTIVQKKKRIGED